MQLRSEKIYQISNIPVIDFRPFLNKNASPKRKLSTAKKIDKACREIGFFYIENHGISQRLRNSMLRDAQRFFTDNTPEEKDSLAIKKPGDGIGDSARGFSKMESGEKGLHETLDIFRPVEVHGPPYTTGQGENQWPTKPRTFRATSEAYIDAMLPLANQVLRAMAMALEIDEKIFTSRTDQAFWNLRVVAYENATGSGMGQHTDFGILTFLMSNGVMDSLQVLDKSGAWIPADPKEGCFLVNIGDMLSEWTGGSYTSTTHRVIHNNPGLRISVPFFFDPNWDANIAPVHGPGKDDDTKGIIYRDKFMLAMGYGMAAKKEYLAGEEEEEEEEEESGEE